MHSWEVYGFIPMEKQNFSKIVHNVDHAVKSELSLSHGMSWNVIK